VAKTIRISDEKFREAKGCLRRYAYNKLNIVTIRFDIMNITGINYDSNTAKTNRINSVVENSVIELEENKELKKSVREIKAIEMTKKIIDEETLFILEHLYDKKDMTKWEIIGNGVSERSFYRKHKELILKIADILEKI